MNFPKRSLTVFSLFVSLQFSLAQCPGVCIPYAYEGFDYPNNSALYSSLDGTGWNGGWDVQNANNTVPGYSMTNVQLPAFSDLQTNGITLTCGQSYLSAGRGLDISPGGLFAPLLNGNGLIGEAGTSLWFSALMRKNQNNDDGVYLNLHDGNTAWYDNFGGVQRLGIGYYGTDSNTGGDRFWSILVADSVYQSPVQITVGSDALLVVQIDFDANDNHIVHFFVNPSSIGSTTPTPDLMEALVAEPLEFRSLKMYGTCCPGGAVIDEIRLADSYQCATPDASTLVNEAPTASFTASAASGMVPVTVNFDASASFDPNGTIVSYLWDFGDGTDTGVLVSHTFTFEGLQQVQLTVIDDCGSAHTASLGFAGLDPAGNFSCVSSIWLEQLATEGNNDGSFGLGFGLGDSAELFLPGGGSVVQATGTFAGLANDEHTLVVTGQNGCVDSFQIHVPLDSATVPGWAPDPCSHSIGVNLDGVPYWNLILPFKDFAKYGDEYFTGWAGFGGPWNSGYINDIARDTAGYPLELPYDPGNGDGPQMVRGVISADGHMPLGSYVMLYDGSGTLTMNGNAVATSNTAGRMEFDVVGLGNIWYHIEQSQLGDHIRNIRIVRTEHESSYLSEPFYEVFLQRMQPFAALRFMDWGLTNNSGHVEWGDRNQPYYHTQGHNGGVAYEYMVELANLTQKDIWVCVPHAADDNYITQMARLFRDSLDPNLTIYLEYSNEVWNWFFQQAHWVENWRPNHLNQQRAFAERCRLVFETWKAEFAAQPDRVKRVVGTQVVNPYLAQQAMAQLKGAFDYVSPTWYFGYGGPCATNLAALGASATPQDVLDCTRESWLGIAAASRQTYWNARLYGKGVIEYEGGQHMTSNPVVEPFQQAVYDAQIHPGIYDLYQEVLDSVKLWGSALSMAFTLASVRESVYGSWGALEYIDQDLNAQPSYKYQVLMDNLNNCPANLNCVEHLSIPLVPMPNSVYRAANQVSSSGLVQPNGLVSFKAGNEVDLLPGFETGAGAEFEALIEACDEVPLQGAEQEQ